MKSYMAKLVFATEENLDFFLLSSFLPCEDSPFKMLLRQKSGAERAAYPLGEVAYIAGVISMYIYVWLLAFLPV